MPARRASLSGEEGGEDEVELEGGERERCGCARGFGTRYGIAGYTRREWDRGRGAGREDEGHDELEASGRLSPRVDRPTRFRLRLCSPRPSATMSASV